MREIDVSLITQNIKEMCILANKKLPQDLVDCISCSGKKEKLPLAKGIMDDLMENLKSAEELDLPICQDTGMAVIFLEVGQDVHFVGGNFEDAVNEGVSQGYVEGLLRCSVVKDPIRRGNTGNNTPAVIHTKIVDGDKVKIVVAPKGFGSENMSALKMLTPSASREDIINFVCESVLKAGSNPCPPIVVGVGIGGDFEYSAVLAKKALCRSVSKRNEDEFYKDLEEEMLTRINALNVGPQGFGGETTALAVNIETYPTHIAGLPLAVNVGCHVTRHATRTI